MKELNILHEMKNDKDWEEFNLEELEEILEFIDDEE